MGKNAQENALDARLEAVYSKHGLKFFLEVCSQMLVVPDKKPGAKKPKVNGEVCEVVLKVCTKHYLKENGFKGQVFHSLVLKDLDRPDSSFRTELDFTLLTPHFAMTAECKSYAGDILVTNNCTINRDSTTADVYRQSVLHVKSLRQYLKRVQVPGPPGVEPVVGATCFLYSNGNVQDQRRANAKKALPVLTVSTLFDYYDRIFKRNTKVMYDYEKAVTMFSRIEASKKLHQEHKDFLGY